MTSRKSHLDTPVAEQTFIWAGRFKKIMCAMPKRRFLFFYLRMVIPRNRYTTVLSRKECLNFQPYMGKVKYSKLELFKKRIKGLANPHISQLFFKQEIIF